MKKTKLKVLAIDPGIRKMGVAFLEGDNLIYHGVKTIKKSQSPHEAFKECRKTVLRLVNDFNPNIIVVEKAFFPITETLHC